MTELWAAARQFLGEFFSLQTLQGLGGWLAAVYVGLCAVLSWVGDSTHPSVPFLIVLTLIDFALGAGIAWWEGHPTAQGFRRGFGKFVGYALIFIVTAIADRGMGLSGTFFNITLMVSAIALSRETLSCLRHIDYLFPGLLPQSVLRRLETYIKSVERDTARQSRRNDWREREADRPPSEEDSE